MKMIQEFKEFAVKGNMFDMAVGIIIGTAFGNAVSSLVKDVLMPALSFLIGRVDFKDLKYVDTEQKIDVFGKITEQTVTVYYGLFIQSMIDFLIIALTIFFVIKIFNTLKRKSEDTKEKSVPTPRDIQLLTSINENLKNIYEQAKTAG